MREKSFFRRRGVLFWTVLAVSWLAVSSCEDGPIGDYKPDDGSGDVPGVSEAYVIETQDCGRTWGSPYRYGPASSLVDLERVDNLWGQEVIIASGTDANGKGVILRTTNLGVSWTKVLGDYSDVTFFTDLDAGSLPDWAAAVGDAGAIFVSRANGTGWVQKNSQTTADLLAVNFHKRHLDPMTGFAVGDNGTILRSVDSGETWYALTSPTTLALNDVRAFGGFLRDPTFVVVVGYEGIVLRSLDVGASWNVQYLHGGRTLNAVHFSDEALNGGYGIAVSSGGQIFKSTDDGATWALKATFAGIPLSDVRATNLGFCVAVGEHHILFSEDQGETWSVSYSDGARRQYFYGLLLPNDSLYGIAVGKTY